MSLRSVLKKNKGIRIIGKKVKIYFEYIYDAHDFSVHFIESKKRVCDFKYSIMLIVHSLEKGMCMPNARPFGKDKTIELISMLKTYSEDRKDEFEYQLAIAVLFAWKEFFQDHNWEENYEFEEVCKFLENKEQPSLKAGYKIYVPNREQIRYDDIENMFWTRHSVRNYQNRKIEKKDIEFAIKCFIEVPTACNRQMCKVYYIEDSQLKSYMDSIIIGLPGFNKEHINYFVITYDMAAFAYSGERNQGMLNVGLCTMNLINALHIRGIGSCCLQWSNKRSEDMAMRRRMNLLDSERIGIVIGAGYYLNENIIPCSTRRSVDDIFKVL